MRILATMLLSGALAGCGAADTTQTPAASDGAPPAAGTSTAAATAFPGQLPESFTGVLPRDEREGIRHIVELYPENRVFVHRTIDLDRGATGSGADAENRDDMGRWELTPDGGRLILRGGREAPVQFAITDAGTLRLLDAAGRAIEPQLDELTRSSRFEPIEPQLFMRGMYSYFADAGWFLECSTGWRLPVSPEADNAALERAYLAARTEPGEPLLVGLEGRIAMRPKMEGDGMLRFFVPVRFGEIWPDRTCETASSPDTPMTSLDRTRWSLLDSQLAVPAPDERDRVMLEFTAERLLAHSGCNSATGSYRIENGALVTGPMATTRMACIGAAGQYEPAFFAFLAARPILEHDGDELLLESATGRLRFRAVAMPSARAVQKFIYVASERKPCTGVAPMQCLQIREKESDPWQLYYGEIIGFTHERGIEYRLRILEDEVPNPPADAPSRRWFLDLVVEQRVVAPR